MTRISSRFIPMIFATFLIIALTGCSEERQQEKPAAVPEHTTHEEQAPSEENPLGTVDFQVDCSEASQAAFDRALGLMHHMMYAQSRRTFEKIIETDPDCAMAHWGVASTLFQPLWGTRPAEKDLVRGWEHIGKARDRVESSREQLLVEATAGFFREPETADFRTRVDRWANGMEAAYQAHAEDHDIAALYALSRLTLAQQAKDNVPLLDEAEAILRDIYKAIPDHPGAIHYSIHATDVDGRARNALDMVEAYSKIAPDVAHALHMPSHIYVRLGDWPRVIEWNRRSADAAVGDSVEGGISHHYIHAIDYLVYAYLQQGEDDKALAAFQEAMERDRHQASFVSTFHFAAIPARLAVEQGQWQQAAAMEPRTPEYLPWDASVWAEGLSWYARGLGGVHTGELKVAREAAKKLEALRDRAKADGDAHFASYIETDRRILAGRLAHADGETKRALELLRSAAELESSLEKHPVTPGALLPPNEALGNLLMELDRPKEALAAYRDSERIWPGRYNTLLGVARAAKAAGDEPLARQYYARLITIAGNSQRSGIAEATASMGSASN